MPKPTRQRLSKARTACLETAATLRRHPEFDSFRPEENLHTQENDHSTIITADIRFDKNGQHVLRTPEGLQGEDYDYPTLVGGKILYRAAQDAARKTKLKLTANVNIHIVPSEKGWVEVGYQFIHENKHENRQA